ncbi:hypothetical protein Tco_0588452, partial [Tanacetum coccineum]
MTHFNPRRNMIPQVVLMRSGIKAVNTAKPKDAHNVVKRNRFNTVKASACWVWMPKNRVIDHVSKNNSASVTLKRFDYIGAQEKDVNTKRVQMMCVFAHIKVLFSEEVVVLKREVGIKEYEINMLKTEFEKVKQEKDAIDFKIEKFVPPPHPLVYNRPNKLDLSYSGLDEFKEPEFKGYGPRNNKKESNVICDKESENSKHNYVKSLVEEQVSQVKSSFVEGSGSNTSKSVSEVEPKKVWKNNDAPIIEDCITPRVLGSLTSSINPQ